MEDYKSMYYRLFNGVTDVIEMLKAAQTETEDMFIEAGDLPPKPFPTEQTDTPINGE